jgi:hypothetical protein
MEWKAATLSQVGDIVKADLAKCDAEQMATFRQCSVEPYYAPIVRYGELGRVVIVARKSDEVMYWEDVEEGFNISPVGQDGVILEPGWKQDELRWALNRWIEGRLRK